MRWWERLTLTVAVLLAVSGVFVAIDMAHSAIYHAGYLAGQIDYASGRCVVQKRDSVIWEERK